MASLVASVLLIALKCNSNANKVQLCLNVPKYRRKTWQMMKLYTKICRIDTRQVMGLFFKY